MKVTGRLQGHSAPAADGQDAQFLATQSGEEIARAARVEALRKLVASGRYTVNADHLADTILRRALRKR